jgi:hypothetical protein
MALLCTIFIGFRGPQALDDNLAKRPLAKGFPRREPKIINYYELIYL